MQYKGKNIYEESPSAADCFRQKYVDSIGRYLSGLEVEAYGNWEETDNKLKHYGSSITALEIYEDSCAVVCDNLVTSRRPEDLPYFMKEFISIL